jgi:hypothetical protein
MNTLHPTAEAKMSRLSFKGILLGGITDIVATNIFALPIIVYLMFRKMDLAHLASDQVTPAITAALQSNKPLFALSLMIGSACSVLGGYVGARLAKHDELLNGALTSFLCLGFGIYALTTGTGSGSPTMKLLEFTASPALGLLGGYLRAKQKSPDADAPQPTAAIANQ